MEFVTSALPNLMGATKTQQIYQVLFSSNKAIQINEGDIDQLCLPTDQAWLIESVAGVAAIAGGLVAVYNRINASKRIG